MACHHFIVHLHTRADDRLRDLHTKLTADTHQHTKFFSDGNACLAFLRSQPNQRMFIILSGSVEATLVSLIVDCANVHRLYRLQDSFEIDVDKQLNFDREDDLLHRLFHDVELYLRQQADLCIEQAIVFKARAKSLGKGSCG